MGRQIVFYLALRIANYQRLRTTDFDDHLTRKYLEERFRSKADDEGEEKGTMIELEMFCRWISTFVNPQNGFEKMLGRKNWAENFRNRLEQMPSSHDGCCLESRFFELH